MAKKFVTHVGLMVVGLCTLTGAAWAQDAPNFAGRWTVNPTLSQAPKEIGFGVDWADPAVTGTPESGGSYGGGGRRRGGGGGRTGQAYPPRPESAADAQRLRQLTDEVRQAPTHLTIVDAPAEVAITNPDREQTRKFHPNGRDEVIQLDGTDVAINAKRDAGRLIVLYEVEQGRQIRYTYFRVASPSQIIVSVDFVGRGGGDQVKLVYEPRNANEPEKPVAPTVPAVPTAPAGTTPASSTQQPLDQGPDAELKGLRKIGVVVEGLGDQAVKCGLKQDVLESSVTKRLTDAGFTVPRNTDEDTYLYVNVMTASLSNGYCVSRYDASLNTHTTATLSYQPSRVLVEVSLLHKGGIAGGAPAVHADGVVKGLLDYLDGFITRIREANKAH